jgi:hypothetical protein
MKMLRELRAADKEVAGWRKLMQEILACEQRDLEGFVTTRRDKVREASPFLTPSASEQWSVGGHEADTHVHTATTDPSLARCPHAQPVTPAVDRSPIQLHSVNQ